MALTAAEAGIACDREMITSQIEVLLNQLEQGKYNKQEVWAAKIEGGIEMLLWVRDGKDGAAGDVLQRMERAKRNIMGERPEAPGMAPPADNPTHVQQLQPVPSPENPPGPAVLNPPPAQPAQPEVPPPGSTPAENPQRQ